jgi:hypothetical protein
LGGSGKLIAPVQVEGKWYYYWDRSGDGTNANAGSLNSGTDTISHTSLSAIFNEDINGNVNPNAATTGTTDVYRYATINGLRLALPTANGGQVFPQGLDALQNGTSATTGGSSSFDEYLAIWDTHNGTGTGSTLSGTPADWVNSVYWSSTQTGSNQHAYINLGEGRVQSVTDSSQARVALEVVKPNIAPVLDTNASPIITAVQGGVTPVNNVAAGTLVSSLVAGVSDADGGALQGIAITGFDSTNGTLYYSTNGGTTWANVGSVSSTSALLLSADSDTRLYFAPTSSTYMGSTSPITFRAWDGTQHNTEGVKVDASVTDKASEFSKTNDTMTVAVTDSVAPTLAISMPMTSGVNGIQTVTFKFSEAVNDFTLSDISADNGSMSGLAEVDSTNWTATYTPNPGISSASSAIRVAANSYTDLAGNNGQAGQVTYSMNTTLSAAVLASDGTSVANWSTSGGVLDYAGISTYFNPIFVGGTINVYRSGALQASRAITTNDTGWVYITYSNWNLLFSPIPEGEFTSTLTYNGQTVSLPKMTRIQSNSVSTYTSPLVLDLNGDGVQTQGIESSGVKFDLLDQGIKAATGWVDRHDGLLAIDLNGDGHINSGAELFGSGTKLANGTKAADGWQALTQHDINNDGKIDASDAVFTHLRVWVDANGDGNTDAGELHTLADLGIASIAVTPDQSMVAQNGNYLRGFSSYTTQDGAAHAVADAWFVQSATQSHIDDVDFDVRHVMLGKVHTLTDAEAGTPVVGPVKAANVLSLTDLLPAPDWQAHDLTTAHAAYSLNSTTALTEELLHKVAA